MNFLVRKFNRYRLYYANSMSSSDWIVKICCDYEHFLNEEDLTPKAHKHPSDEKELRQEKGTAITRVGMIKFFKDDSKILKNDTNIDIFRKDKTKSLLNQNYSLSQFNDIMSILRYEDKPLYFFLEADTFKGGISTTKEPYYEETLADKIKKPQ